MSIDLETYSDVDISKCGAYKYAESDNFEILLFGVSIDGGEVQVFDLACGDTIPDLFPYKPCRMDGYGSGYLYLHCY